MQEGTVKWFNDDKCFGFIVSDNVKEDILVHQSEIRMSGFRTLAQGQKVKFDMVRSNKGLHARNVILTDRANVKTCQECGHEQVEVSEATDEN